MKKRLIGSIVIVVIVLAVVPTGALAEEYSLDDLYTIALQRSEKIKVSEETGKQVFWAPLYRMNVHS